MLLNAFQMNSIGRSPLMVIPMLADQDLTHMLAEIAEGYSPWYSIYWKFMIFETFDTK